MGFYLAASLIDELLYLLFSICGGQVQAYITVVEDFKVSDAIVKYISWSGVWKLVMGSPSRNAFARFDNN